MAFREYTIKLLNALQEGVIDRDTVITAALQHMSEDEVRSMCEANGFFEDDEEADAPPVAIHSPSVYQALRFLVAVSKAARQPMRYSAKMKSGVLLPFSRE